MDILINGLIVLMVAAFMEFVAWATHKYVMHGFLWVLHEDHHRPTGRGLQKNDLFAVFFAIPSFLLIYNGLQQPWYPLAAAGFGVALYGVGYVLFHDVMFHRRLRFIHYKPKSRYLQRIIRAHQAHHRYNNKEDSISFGFLYAPRKYDLPNG